MLWRTDLRSAPKLNVNSSREVARSNGRPAARLAACTESTRQRRSHDGGLEAKKALIQKAHEALPAGGCFIAIENVIDDERRQNTFGLLMSLNMLIETRDGFDYTAAQFRSWCLDAGFRSTELMPLTGPTSAAIAHK
jgi:O-methyltransferase domain